MLRRMLFELLAVSESVHTSTDEMCKDSSFLGAQQVSNNKVLLMRISTYSSASVMVTEQGVLPYYLSPYSLKPLSPAYESYT